MSDKSRKRTKIMVGTAIIVIFSAVLLMLGMFSCSPKTESDNVIKLKYSSPYMPTEPPNLQAIHAMDLIEEKTNGRVKFERFMGGSLGGVLEHIDLISSGAVDVIGLHIDQYPQQLPLHSLLNSEQLVSGKETLANINIIRYEIPETKAILDAEQKKNNIKILSGYVQGSTGITTGFRAESLADLRGKKVNVIASFQRKVFNELDWIPVNVQTPELYESLSRGVIDAIFMATSAVLPLKWYEVGKTHLMLCENQVVSQPLTVNLDVWNSLPEDIQKIFEEASWETSEWSIEADKTNMNNTYEAFKKAGVPIIELSEEDNMMFWEVYLRHGKENYLDNAEKMGVLDQARVIQKYWDEMKWGNWKK